MPNPVEGAILKKHPVFGVIVLPSTAVNSGRRVAPQNKKPSPFKRLGFLLYIILVILSALIVGAYAVWNFVVKEPEIPVQPAPSISAPQVEAPPAASESEKPDELVRARREGVYTFALLGSDKASTNTDTIILVTFDTKEHTVGMVSVPRDTAVERSWAKYPKINAAYSKGSDVLKEEIYHTFGIPVDFYIKIDLNAFIALVDELGGVDVYIPINMSYDDPYQDLHIHYTKGQHHLSGQQAMEVVRFRHNNDSEGGGGYNDEGRSAMQRTVLVSLAKKVLSWNSLTKLQNFLDIFQTYIKTDLSASDIAWFAAEALKVDLSTGLTQGTLEGRGDGVYKGHSWCYIFEEETILPTLNSLLNPYNMDLTAGDLNLPNASRYLQ